jgi:hypothetical protein
MAVLLPTHLLPTQIVGSVKLVFFMRPLSKRGCSQASRVALTGSGRRNNSSGDDFTRHFRLAGFVKLAAGCIERFTHRRNRLRLERSRLQERMNWHGRYPPPQLSARPNLEMDRGLVKRNRDCRRSKACF